MPSLKMPHDKASAKDIMKKFPDMAYSVKFQNIFQEAVNIVHGCEFRITLDISKRMQFSCLICSREMNSENAVVEHSKSGNHMKNLDKTMWDTPNLVSRAAYYAKDSIQYWLLTSSTKPLGLQMIEEFINKKGYAYYKCILCGAHGNISIMYHHIIGKKHTEKYIKSGCVLQESILIPAEREELRLKLINIEGINVDAMKTFRGNTYYPYQWEKEGHVMKKYNDKLRQNQLRSALHSPSPGPSWRRSPSPLTKRGRTKKKKKNHKNNRRSSRSSSSSSSSNRGSCSPHARKKRKAKRKIIPKQRQSPNQIKRECFPNAPVKIEATSPPRLFPVKIEATSPPRLFPVKIEATSPPRLLDLNSSSVSQDLVAFRNQSPPPVQIKAEPISPRQIENYDQRVSLPMPIDPSMIKIERDNASVQTKVDLEYIMYSFNLFVTKQSHKESSLKTKEDMKAAMDLMNIIGECLYKLAVACLKDNSNMTVERRNMLTMQREKYTKIMGYVSAWYLPTWKAEYNIL